MQVEIRDDGLAAWCCARLLSQSGVPVSIHRPEPRRRPWILVSDPVQKLLCEIAGDADLFRHAPKIRKRHVLWGPTGTASLDHSAAIVDESAFLDRLWDPCGAAFSGGEPASAPAFLFQIVCQRSIHPTVTGGAPMLNFGTRTAQIADVETDARESCWIESFPHGWLFLIAGATTKGSLIAVGAPPHELLASSRLIAPQIQTISDVQPALPAFPRIAQAMYGNAWLACGTAAMALDPICGDGVGHAVREAILAKAVICGGAPAGMLEHYQSRLRLAFYRHLALCRSFYTSANSGSWWDAELAAINCGLEWYRAQTLMTPQYRLDGMDLVSL